MANSGPPPDTSVRYPYKLILGCYNKCIISVHINRFTSFRLLLVLHGVQVHLAYHFSQGLSGANCQVPTNGVEDFQVLLGDNNRMTHYAIDIVIAAALT